VIDYSSGLDVVPSAAGPARPSDATAPGRCPPFRSAAPLLEGVEHVDTLFELCNVDHTMLKPRVNADLPYARANRGHRLPVGRLQPTLDLIELVPCALSSVLRKGSHVFSRAAHPQDRPPHRRGLYNFLYHRSTPPDKRLRRTGTQP